jgi:hypothetical protein
MQVVAAWLQNDDTHSWRLQQRMMCRRYMHLLGHIGNQDARANVLRRLACRLSTNHIRSCRQKDMTTSSSRRVRSGTLWRGVGFLVDRLLRRQLRRLPSSNVTGRAACQ